MDVDAVLAGLVELIAPHLTESSAACWPARVRGRWAAAFGRPQQRPVASDDLCGVRELDERPDPGGRVRRLAALPARAA